jgi:hypothetical protein
MAKEEKVSTFGLSPFPSFPFSLVAEDSKGTIKIFSTPKRALQQLRVIAVQHRPLELRKIENAAVVKILLD